MSADEQVLIESRRAEISKNIAVENNLGISSPSLLLRRWQADGLSGYIVVIIFIRRKGLGN
jgi:hypothetical protein